MASLIPTSWRRCWLDRTEHLRPSISSALVLSAIVPGLGQLVQGRYVTATIQFSTVVACLASAAALGGPRMMWLGVFWNVLSAIDAQLHSDD